MRRMSLIIMSAEQIIKCKSCLMKKNMNNLAQELGCDDFVSTRVLLKGTGIVAKICRAPLQEQV